MPIPLRPKARAKVLRRHTPIESIDWLGVWAISLAFCAINLAGIAYFLSGDNTGASFILVGAAVIIALIVRFSSQHEETN